MDSAIINTRRQIKQLEKFNPAQAQQAAGLLPAFPHHARKIAADGLRAAMAEYNTPQAKLWRQITATAESGVGPGGELLAPATTGKIIPLSGGWYLWCDRDSSYRLSRRYAGTSGVLIRWGRDWDYISSARAGTWILTANARQNFDKYLEEK